MLGDKNFDKRLILIVCKYNKLKNKRITMVFDGIDPVGDKVEVGDNVTVIYSPKDKYYKSADDKIIELVEQKMASTKITVITEDIGLKKAIEKIQEEVGGREIRFKKTSRFVEELKALNASEEADDGRRGLSDGDIKKINDELLKFWK